MSASKLLIFMGPPNGGMYEIVKVLIANGLCAGTPHLDIENQFAVRHQPDHASLWYWRAIRRYFDDFGLPPIAEIPEDRLSCQDCAYYVRAFARTLGRNITHGSFICADHLTSLAWPLVLEAIKTLAVETHFYFFFSHPARDLVMQKLDYGIPPKLSEFTWRNMVAAAARNNQGLIHFINVDQLDPNSWASLFKDIYDFYGSPLPDSMPFPVKPGGFSPEEQISSLTSNLYNALVGHVNGNLSWQLLANVATETWLSQVAQNGWQYVDSLDCGQMDSHARRLLDCADHAGETTDLPAFPVEGETWLNLLDHAERKLLQARQDYATKLFLQAQSLSFQYMNGLEDERLLYEQKQKHRHEKRRSIAKRRKERYRKLFEKALSR